MTITIKNFSNHRDDFQALILGCIDYEEIATYYDDLADQASADNDEPARREALKTACKLRDGCPGPALAYIKEFLTRTRRASVASVDDMIRGLPSFLTVPFTNYDVLCWLYQRGAIESPDLNTICEAYDLDESKNDELQTAIDRYWEKCAAVLLQLCSDVGSALLGMYADRAVAPRWFRVMVNAQEALTVDGLPSFPVMVQADDVDAARLVAREKLASMIAWLDGIELLTAGHVARIPAGAESSTADLLGDRV